MEKNLKYGIGTVLIAVGLLLWLLSYMGCKPNCIVIPWKLLLFVVMIVVGIVFLIVGYIDLPTAN